MSGSSAMEAAKVADFNARSPEMKTITAEYRFQTGKYISKWLRMHGRLPALVFSPDLKTKEIISLDDAEMVRLLRDEEHWFSNTVYNLHVAATADKPERKLRVLPKQVFMHPARRGHVMNLIFIEFVPDHKYNLSIPVRFEGIEDCKGCKAGGVFLFGQEDIDCTWQGDENIPRDLVCNLVPVDKGESVTLNDLGQLPKGLKLRGRVAKANPVVCHVAKTGGEVSRTTPPWLEVEDEYVAAMKAKYLGTQTDAE